MTYRRMRTAFPSNRKADKERGLYLHPELFGAPAERSIVASRHAIAAEVKKGDVRVRPTATFRKLKGSVHN